MFGEVISSNTTKFGEVKPYKYQQIAGNPFEATLS